MGMQNLFVRQFHRYACLIFFYPVFLAEILLNSCQPSNADEKLNGKVGSSIDEELVEFIDGIKAVDNHAHVNTIEPGDTGADALPLETIFPFEVPARLRPDSPDWLSAYKALYGYRGSDFNDSGMNEAIKAVEMVQKERGEKFPEWVLDQTGIEVMLANRLKMGPGLSQPRFRWVSYVDAFLFPLSNEVDAAKNPDRQKLFPIERQHLKNYLADLGLTGLPLTLDEYLNDVINPTLESQSKNGCLAVKFEVAFLRSLDFGETPVKTAAQVYSKYINGGNPSPAENKSLQDFLFRYISYRSGQLGMAVQIHVFPGPGNHYEAAGSDPLLLESAFNDTTLRRTKFVIIHGGGAFHDHTAMMLWKPNVYADISALTRLWTSAYLANVLKDWLSQYPEKVLFGTDAASVGPGLGWELGAWIAMDSGKKALAIALSGMIENKEVTRQEAKEIARMVLRTNAGNLYNLGLK